MNDFWQSIKKHNVLRITAAYLMAGWIIMQIVEVMGPALRMPEWIDSAIAFILIFTLPIVVLIAWSMDHKQKQAKLADGGTQPARATGKLDYVLFGGAALVLALVVGRWFLPPNSQSTGADQTAAQVAALTDGTGAEDAATALADQEKSIAVLPFADMSPNGDQEYFSDGITEEIINALNDVENLRVTGRTSSFAFKGKNDDLKSIGRVLKVRHVLEGSVRKQGNQVRITAQLIKVEDGFHEWSETYDAPLDDIFGVQEEIAAAITEKLEVLLDDKGEGSDYLPPDVPKSVNPEASETYFQAKYLMSRPGPGNVNAAVSLLEEAVELDPDFHQAWATLATAHITSLMDGTDFEKKHLAAEASARKALDLAPETAEAHAGLGWVQVQRRNYIEMHTHFDRALNINADNPVALNWYSYGLLSVGKHDQAIEYFKRATEVDPVQPMHYFFLATAYLMDGQIDLAEKYAKQTRALGFLPANMPLADIAAVRGEGEKAASLAKSAMGMLARDFSRDEIAEIADAVFGGVGDHAAVRDMMLEIMQEPGQADQIFFPNFFVMLGEPELAFEAFENNQFAFDQPFYVALWGPFGKKARQHPDFPGLAARIGLVEYWQQHGWPEMCQPVGQESGASEGVSFTCS